MSTINSDVTNNASAERFLGRVKWFNNKAGYGFITLTNGDKSGTDIFVHHSSIKVSNQQYKYLVQGEYVELSVISVDNSVHQYQASDVSGLHLGKLMCETRFEYKNTRSQYQTEDKTNAVRSHGEGPRESDGFVEKKVRAPRSVSAPTSNAGRGRGRPAKTSEQTSSI